MPSAGPVRNNDATPMATKETGTHTVAQVRAVVTIPRTILRIGIGCIGSTMGQRTPSSMIDTTPFGRKCSDPPCVVGPRAADTCSDAQPLPVVEETPGTGVTVTRHSLPFALGYLECNMSVLRCQFERDARGYLTLELSSERIDRRWRRSRRYRSSFDCFSVG